MANTIYIATNIGGIYADSNGTIGGTIPDQFVKVKRNFDEFFDNFTGDVLSVNYLPIDRVDIFADGVKLYEGVERDFTRIGVNIYFNYMLVDKNVAVSYKTESI